MAIVLTYCCVYIFQSVLHCGGLAVHLDRFEQLSVSVLVLRGNGRITKAVSLHCSEPARALLPILPHQQECQTSWPCCTALSQLQAQLRHTHCCTDQSTLKHLLCVQKHMGSCNDHNDKCMHLSSFTAHKMLECLLLASAGTAFSSPGRAGGCKEGLYHPGGSC